LAGATPLLDFVSMQQTILLMKKTLLTLTMLTLGVSTLFAQFKPEEGNYGITFGINGLQTVTLEPLSSGTVGFRYVMANNLWARVNLNVTSLNTKLENTQGGYLTNNKTSGTNFALSVGAQKNFEGTDRLNPYFGIDLSIGNSGGGKTVNRTEVVNADSTLMPGDANGDFTEITTKNPKGMAIGLTPVVGFQYFFAQNFAVGAEFGWGFFMNSTKGGETTIETKSGSNTTTNTSTNNSKSSSSGFGTSGSGRITVSVFF
jgi:uncharacterized membrane protein (DUF441 family)